MTSTEYGRMIPNSVGHKIISQTQIDAPLKCVKSLAFCKGGFFQKVRFVFLNLQKNVFQKTILSSKFKFQVQDSFLEYFWGGGDLEI